MRYYVLCFSDYQDIVPHIIAEVVRDGVDEDRSATLASAIAGEHAVIATRSELLADIVGREALEAWEAGIDEVYYRETEAIMAAGDRPGDAGRLHLVEDDERLQRRTGLGRAEHYLEVRDESRKLRATTRNLVERSREQRAAIKAARGIRRLKKVVDDGT